MSRFMKTNGPSGLAKPRGPGAPCEPARRYADEPQGNGGRTARHEIQGRQGEVSPHMRAARHEAILATRSASDGGDVGGRSRLDDAWIAKCLDHAASKKQRSRSCRPLPARSTITQSG